MPEPGSNIYLPSSKKKQVGFVLVRSGLAKRDRIAASIVLREMLRVATSIRIVRRGGEVNAVAVAVRPSIRRLIRRGTQVCRNGVAQIHYPGTENSKSSALVIRVRVPVPRFQVAA